MVIEARDVTFSYGGIKALRGATLRVREGEVSCLLGPNGSGKTTLIKCILGILSPYGGSIKVMGREVSGLGRREAARLMSYVPQSHRAVFPFNVESVVLLGRSPWLSELTGPSEEDLEVVDRVLKRLGIEHLRGRPYTRLSGGEMRMVLIARSLAQETPIILMDEPTAFLDFKHQNRVMGMIRELLEEGKSVLISLHDPNMASMYCDRIFLMKEGVVEGEYDGPLDREVLEEIYGMELIEVRKGEFRFILPRGALRVSSRRPGS